MVILSALTYIPLKALVIGAPSNDSVPPDRIFAAAAMPQAVMYHFERANYPGADQLVEAVPWTSELAYMLPRSLLANLYSDEMPTRHSLHSSKPMPHLSDTSRSISYLGEFKTDMYMDIVIKEFSTPELSTPKDQESNTSPDTVASQDQEFNTSPNTMASNDGRHFL